MRKSALLYSAACLFGGLVEMAASAQTYPVRPVRFVVGYTPGGGTDVMTRILAKYLTDSLKQTVLVDNRPGAGAILATELVAKAPPDGYTLLTTPSTHAINPGLYAKLPYDTIKDFTAIGLSRRARTRSSSIRRFL
ncbi:MAG: Bug family tripartite tricarboxylate transporter substrate binding protein [Burkholderiales bacterium]